jgi:hypothetical protein
MCASLVFATWQSARQYRVNAVLIQPALIVHLSCCYGRPYLPDGQPNQNSSIPIQPGSFSPCSHKLRNNEINEMVERWQKYAEGIIIFVRPRVTFHTV